MRLWAEERKSGSIEMLMTLPVSRATLVTGKFLAAWFCAGLALLLTFDAADGELPRLARQRRDHRRLPGRLAAVRRLPGHRILHVGAGEESDHRLCPDRSRLPAVRRRRHSHVQQALSGWLPQWLLDGIASLSVLVRFEALGRGVLDVRDLAYFFSLIVAWLVATTIIIDLKKAA